METKRVLIVGAFDLLSIQDMRIFENFKADGTLFVVAGVYDDETLQENNILSVMTGFERSENLKHSRYVDEICYPCPYYLTSQYLQDNRIDAVFANKYDERFREIGEVFRELPETTGTTTNEIIGRVLNEFDEYCNRTFSRGYSYKDVGLNEVEAKCMFLRLGHNKIKHRS
jgi:choline-phosphate cytidylyltransferase